MNLTKYRAGKTKLFKIALRNGVKKATFYNRIRRGWTPEKAATTPPRPYFYEWSRPCT